MNKIILSLAIGLSLLAGCNAPKEVVGDDRSLDFTADWAFRLGDDTHPTLRQAYFSYFSKIFKQIRK